MVDYTKPSSQERSDKTPSPEDKAIQTLLAAAEPDIKFSPERRDRLFKATEASWQQHCRQPSPKRRHFGLAAAVTMLAITLGLYYNNHYEQSSTILGPVSAQVEKIKGNLHLIDNTSHKLSVTDLVYAGQRIMTGAHSGAALELLSRQSLRLDADTTLQVDSASEFRLLGGALYFDSGATSKKPPIRIQTPLGIASNIGTQFEIRLFNNSILIRVREGEVGFMEHTTLKPAKTIMAQEQLLINSQGGTSKEHIDTDSTNWHWAQDLAPGFDMNGRSVAESLNWIIRENGWTLHYQSPQIAQRVAQETMYGSIQGLDRNQMLDVLSTTTAFTFTINDRQLLVGEKVLN